MNSNEQLIHQFYTAFTNADAKSMCECYHPKVQFRDPAFGLLKEKEVAEMWKMLLKKSKGNIKIEYSDVHADAYSGTARWIATYNFSKTNRKVINKIHAQFQFQDGLILKHTDIFDIWKWSKQALGWKGYLLGWTGFMQSKIQQQALFSLKAYQKSN